MNITNRGKKWELLNSLWVLWSFTLVLACVGFFWIGGRAGRRKWIISGLIYLFVNFGMIYVSQWLRSTNAIFADIISIIVSIGWFAAIIQSFMSRKEYLLRREAVVDLKDATRDAYRNEIRKDYLGNREKPVQSASLPKVNADSSSVTQISPAAASTQKIDLNICSEQDLASLPGVGIVLAKKAVEMRVQIGGFSSVQDFNQRLGLMPHFAVQIENLASAAPIAPQTPSPENKGRVIDI